MPEPTQVEIETLPPDQPWPDRVLVGRAARITRVFVRGPLAVLWIADEDGLRHRLTISRAAVQAIAAALPPALDGQQPVA